MHFCIYVYTVYTLFHRHLHRVLPWNHQSTIKDRDLQKTHWYWGKQSGGMNIPTKAGSHLKMSTNRIHQFPIKVARCSWWTLPKFHNSPLKVVHARKETNHFPAINFQVLLLMEEILHQLIRILYFLPIIYSVLYNPGGFLAGFPNHQLHMLNFEEGIYMNIIVTLYIFRANFSKLHCGKLTSLQPTKITGVSQEDSKWLLGGL